MMAIPYLPAAQATATAKGGNSGINLDIKPAARCSRRGRRNNSRNGITGRTGLEEFNDTPTAIIRTFGGPTNLLNGCN